MPGFRIIKMKLPDDQYSKYDLSNDLVDKPEEKSIPLRNFWCGVLIVLTLLIVYLSINAYFK